MKKAIALILSLFAFTATGCNLFGPSDEQKTCDSEAEQLLANDSHPFIDKAKSIYGNDAEVTDIACMKFLATGLFNSVYMADERISGTLALRKTARSGFRSRSYRRRISLCFPTSSP